MFENGPESEKIEHTVDYSSMKCSKKGADMTVLDDRPVAAQPMVARRLAATAGRAVNRRRPPTGALPYRGSGVAVSRAPHVRRRRPVSGPVTAGLAVVAALITLSLGLVANLSGGPSSGPVTGAERLAVVRVGSGESLQQLAGRIAPDAPVTRVVARIRELNKLESASVLAGQTLIAPVG